MELPIIVEKVIFRKDDGFAILAVNLNAYSSKYHPDLEEVLEQNVKLNKYNNFTVTIGMMDPHEKIEGRQYIFVGEFIKHEKFGEQFKAEFYYQDEPTTEDGLKIYLMSLPNIKNARSTEILNRFGVKETVRILDDEPERLIEINGITKKRIPPIKEVWDRDKALRELYIWLSEHGVDPKIGKKVYEKWGAESLEILTKNPYELIDIRGIDFKRADYIAHKVFNVVPNESRVTACMQYILSKDVFKNSNLCTPYYILKNDIIEEIAKSNEVMGKQEKVKTTYLPSISKSIKSNLDLFAAVKDISDEKPIVYIYLRDIWDKEKYIASNVYHRGISKEEAHTCTEDDLEEAQNDVVEFSGFNIELDECQKEAIKSAFENKITVITGGGGTGKSTICRCIFHLAEEKRLHIRMMSPTGKAAQVLANKTSYGAETIHRSLRMRPGDDFPKEKIQEDIIIIDEISMVGVDTMYAIMYALEENPWANIILVGDANQLPSVSPGNFLSDIIKSGCVNVVKLNKIHRQDENSYISLLANDIAKGRVVEIPESATDIKWRDISSANMFDEKIRSVVKKYLEKGYRIDDLQIMSPMYKGYCGVNKINDAMQELMAEINQTKSKFLKRSFSVLHEGDRVIQTENNYDKEIFNGDMGTVVSVGRKVVKPDESDEQEDFVTVNFYGNDLMYIGEEIDQLKLAWCCTVHKFQGSQCPNIIFVMAQEARIMASKELLYTAMTRAEKYLSIYGHINIFKLAPTKSIVKKRYTNMNNIIRELKENRKLLEVLE